MTEAISALAGVALGLIVLCEWLSIAPGRQKRKRKSCPWRPSGEPKGLTQRKHKMYFEFMSEDRKWSTYRCGRCGHEEIIETPTVNVHQAALSEALFQ